MPNDEKTPAPATEPAPATPEPDELGEDQLRHVAGGVIDVRGYDPVKKKEIIG